MSKSKRLTNKLRQQLLADMSRALLKPTVDAAYAKHKEAMQKAYDVVMTPEQVKLLEALSKHYGKRFIFNGKLHNLGPYTYQIRGSTHIHSSIGDNEIDTQNWKWIPDVWPDALVFDKECPWITNDRYCVSADSNNKVYQKALKILDNSVEQWRATMKEVRQMVGNLYDVLYSCNTVDQLLKILPKAKEYLPAEEDAVRLPIPISLANKINDLLPV